MECLQCRKQLSTYTKKGINYLRCHRCKQIHLIEDKLLQQMIQLFKGLEVPKQELERIKLRLQENHKGESAFYEHNIKRINSEIERNKNRMKVMYEDRLDGRITHVEYDKMIVDLKKKEQDLLDELGKHSKADEAFLISSSYLLELANRAADLFMSSQPAQKNKLLRLVLANLQLKDGKLIPELKNFFAGLQQSNERNEWGGLWDSNP